MASAHRHAFLIVGALCAALLAPAASRAGQPPPGVPPEAAAVLGTIKAADTDLLAVSEPDGEFLRLVAAMNGTKHALEIGGAQGYSAIWIGLALMTTGGHLTSIEFDPARAKEEAENIRRAGLSDVVTVVPGDAFKKIPGVSGTFDFVFLDAWKRDYKRFFDLVWPRVDKGGVFLASHRARAFP
jgi:predicted O-methyltransferase YrrM